MPTILITGTNRGIGLEFVRQYAADGWRVLATVRDPLQGRAVSDAGGEVYVADVADPASITRLAARLRDQSIDILLNNAGTFGERQNFGDVDPDEFLRVVRVNTLGPLKMAEAFVPMLTGRRIIATVSSLMGSVAENDGGGSYAYRASKAAVNMVMKNLAVDLKDKGVTAVALSPGWVRTDMGGDNAPLTPAQSVTGMRGVLAGLTAEDCGKFFHFDGRVLPW